MTISTLIDKQDNFEVIRDQIAADTNDGSSQPDSISYHGRKAESGRLEIKNFYGTVEPLGTAT